MESTGEFFRSLFSPACAALKGGITFFLPVGNLKEK